MIKGRTKIELFDAATGERQHVIEKSNMVTNALRYLINIVASGNRAPEEDIFPIAEKALGGILLFDGALTEDVENIYLPGDVHLTGWANRDASTAAHRGTLNTVESGPTDTGYKSVWDFNTAQANGVIRALALTNVKAAANPLRWQEISSGYIKNEPDHWMYEKAYDGKNVYSLTSENSQTILIYKHPVNLMSRRVYDFTDRETPIEVAGSFSVKPEDLGATGVSFTSSEASSLASVELYHDGGDGCLYAFPYQGSSWGDTIKFIKVRYDDQSFKVTGQLIKTKGVRSQNYYECLVSGGHLYCMCKNQADKDSIMIIDLNNPADQKRVTICKEGSGESIGIIKPSHLPNGGATFTLVKKDGTYDSLIYPDGTYLISDSYRSGGDKETFYVDCSPYKLALVGKPQYDNNDHIVYWLSLIHI